MDKKLKIYNVFGIKPTNNYTSAGMDFYIPNLVDESKQDTIFEAWSKSYKMDVDDIKVLYDMLMNIVIEDNDGVDHTPQIMNILQLYLSLYSKELAEQTMKIDLKFALVSFYNDYVIYDKNGTAGIQMKLNDTLCVNSGLHVALHPGTAGIMFNKSGKGNAGWDTRACVVDEDYMGYVHLSMAYTKDCDMSNKVYCGDKLVQMVVLPVLHMDPVEVTENEYNELMSNSKRGSNAFGSGDVKH